MTDSSALLVSTLLPFPRSPLALHRLSLLSAFPITRLSPSLYLISAHFTCVGLVRTRSAADDCSHSTPSRCQLTVVRRGSSPATSAFVSHCDTCPWPSRPAATSTLFVSLTRLLHLLESPVAALRLCAAAVWPQSDLSTTFSGHDRPTYSAVTSRAPAHRTRLCNNLHPRRSMSKRAVL